MAACSLPHLCELPQHLIFGHFGCLSLVHHKVCSLVQCHGIFPKHWPVIDTQDNVGYDKMRFKLSLGSFGGGKQTFQMLLFS